jgi:hypothetical protein
VVAFFFNLAVITPRKGPGIPNARGELLSEVNMAEPDILGLQATKRIKRVLRAAPDQRLATAHPGARHPEMPKEKLVAPRPLLESLVELIELPGEGLTQTVLVASHLSFAGIREDRDSGITQLNELRLGAKVYLVLSLSPAEHIQVALQLCTVISCDQYYGSVVRHFDKHVNPEIPFFDGGLVGCQVAVNHKEINASPNSICDKPLKTLSGIGEVAVFIEVEIASVGES